MNVRRWQNRYQDRGNRNWFRIENKADADTAEVYIYDVIGTDPWTGEGVGAAKFVEDLNKITQSKIDVHFNTPGGDVGEGIAIYQALKDHDAEVTSIVDSFALSCGSFIAQAGNKRIVQKNSEMMIHKALGICIGNDDDFEKSRDELRRFNENIASIYAERAGGEVSAWIDLMKAETWFNADEAVKAGLADQVGRDKEDDVTNRWSVSEFRNSKPAAILEIKKETPENTVDLDEFRRALKGATA